MAKADPKILSEIESRINKELFIIIPLLVLSAVIPICAWHGFFQQDEEVSIWFQRSGSLMVLFAVWAEYIKQRGQNKGVKKQRTKGSSIILTVYSVKLPQQVSTPF